MTSAPAGTFAISALRASEVPLIADLHAATLPERWTEADLATVFAMPHCFGALARGGDGDIGFGLATAIAGHGEILALGVLPAARRQGAGAALLAWLLAGLDDRDALPVTLEVAADNAPATRLYRQAGFRPIGVRRNYYARENRRCDAVIMRYPADCRPDFPARRIIR